ncbi:unnamed protein product [Prorocentrum cordatum]|uniref:Uncharacterized protein n=1 Tax=Prorocentrum cordatum TaxID=2364126 RepID=A0ABN9V2E3_9DINO|nr:unnamed protein product [Polarella glacialis]
MTRRSQCPLQCFFQAMHALDDSLAVVPLEQPPENSHILPRAAAVWCIIAKSEGFQHITTSLQMVALCVSEFSKRLGTGVPPILAGDIEREELRLLRAGLPDLHEPTMLQWIDLVRERFNVVSRGRAGNVFPATAPWMHSVAALAMHSMPSSEDPSAREDQEHTRRHPGPLAPAPASSSLGPPPARALASMLDCCLKGNSNEARPRHAECPRSAVSCFGWAQPHQPLRLLTDMRASPAARGGTGYDVLRSSAA